MCHKSGAVIPRRVGPHCCLKPTLSQHTLLCSELKCALEKNNKSSFVLVSVVVDCPVCHGNGQGGQIKVTQLKGGANGATVK